MIPFPLMTLLVEWKVTHGMGEGRDHNGIDVLVFPAWSINPVLQSPFAGHAVQFTNEAGGHSIAITDANGWRLGIAHMKETAHWTNPSTGARSPFAIQGRVQAGDIIGQAGKSGHVENVGPEESLVHLTLRPPGGESSADNVDPLPYLYDQVTKRPLFVGFDTRIERLKGPLENAQTQTPVDPNLEISPSPLGALLMLAGIVGIRKSFS